MVPTSWLMAVLLLCAGCEAEQHLGNRCGAPRDAGHSGDAVAIVGRPLGMECGRRAPPPDARVCTDPSDLSGCFNPFFSQDAGTDAAASDSCECADEAAADAAQ